MCERNLSEEVIMKRKITGNPNHPKKGSVIRVQPITQRSDRERIECNLVGQPRNKGIFVTGCNTAYRAVDLTRITVGQVRGARAGFKLLVREQQTGKVRGDFEQKDLRHNE
jgi:hypothetical protein